MIVGDDELENLYSKELLTIREISERFNCSYGYIWKRIHNLNIPIINSRRDYIKRNNKVKMNSFAKSYLDGLIIGDGCIGLDSTYPRYKHSSSKKYNNWLIIILKFFNSLNIKSKISNKVMKEREIKGVVYPKCIGLNLQTQSYKIFKSFYDRWYYNGKKVIPEDINITPQFMANWYMGDGSLNIYKKYRRIRFYTDCFDEIYLNKLINKLNEELNMKFILGYRSNKPIIMLNKQNDVDTLLKYMESYKVDCFNYKWRDAKSL